MSTERDDPASTPPHDRGLRDARLARALEHAPDAQLRPDPSVRHAVLSAARQAAKPASSPAVAKRGRAWAWLWGEGEGRLPWNAAFATLLAAGIVALLWHDEPVPGPTPDAPPPAEARKEAPAPAREAPAATPVPAPASPAAPTPAPAPRAAPAPVPRSEPAPAAPAAPTAPTAPANPPAAAPPQAEIQADMQARMPAVSAAPSAAPAPPAAPAARAFASPPLPSLQASLASERLSGWTSARLSPRAAPLARDDTGELPRLLANLRLREASPGAPRPEANAAREGAATGGASDAAAPRLQIELFEGDRRLGVLDIAPGRARFVDAAGAQSLAPLDAATEAALRAEVARLQLAR